MVSNGIIRHSLGRDEKTTFRTTLSDIHDLFYSVVRAARAELAHAAGPPAAVEEYVDSRDTAENGTNHLGESGEGH